MKPVLLVTLLIALIAAGCSSDGDADHGLLAPSSVPEGTDLATVAELSTCTGSYGSPRVVVPASALRAGTTVAVEWDGVSRCVVAVTGPPLRDDAILSMQKPPDAHPGARYRIMGYDGSSGTWVDLGGTEVKGRVEIAERFVQFSIFDLDDLD